MKAPRGPGRSEVREAGPCLAGAGRGGRFPRPPPGGAARGGAQAALRRPAPRAAQPAGVQGSEVGAGDPEASCPLPPVLLFSLQAGRGGGGGAGLRAGPAGALGFRAPGAALRVAGWRSPRPNRKQVRRPPRLHPRCERPSRGGRRALRPSPGAAPARRGCAPGAPCPPRAARPVATPEGLSAGGCHQTPGRRLGLLPLQPDPRPPAERKLREVRPSPSPPAPGEPGQSQLLGPSPLPAQGRCWHWGGGGAWSGRWGRPWPRPIVTVLSPNFLIY